MPTDQEKNLKVLTDHLRHLAETQHTAANKLVGSNRVVVDPARRVEETHGIICEATHSALAAIEAARRSGLANLEKVSTELSDKLNYAAQWYEDTDAALAQMM